MQQPRAPRAVVAIRNGLAEHYRPQNHTPAPHALAQASAPDATGSAVAAAAVADAAAADLVRAPHPGAFLGPGVSRACPLPAAAVRGHIPPLRAPLGQISVTRPLPGAARAPALLPLAAIVLLLVVSVRSPSVLPAAHGTAQPCMRRSTQHSLSGWAAMHVLHQHNTAGAPDTY